jgi:hypothetical protein
VATRRIIIALTVGLEEAEREIYSNPASGEIAVVSVVRLVWASFGESCGQGQKEIKMSFHLKTAHWFSRRPQVIIRLALHLFAHIIVQFRGARPSQMGSSNYHKC